MTTVILAEKPSVAVDIGRVVGATSRRDGYFETKDGSHKVTWALGHLVELAAPEEIRPEWRRWSALPILPERFPLVPRCERPQRSQLGIIERLFKSRSTRVLVNATDAGREGELIFRYILEWVFGPRGTEKPIKRFWASSLTEDAIREALSAMRSSKAYDGLANAARMRSQLDWLVGMNGTRSLRSFGGRAALPFEQRKQLTVGRVQTPTLAMIVRLDAAIRAFAPKPYCEVQATFACPVARPDLGSPTASASTQSAQVVATYVRLREDEHGVRKWDARLGGEHELPDGSAAEHPAEIMRRARAGCAVLANVQRESRVHRSPLLFDLTTLQREANVLWKWSASKTLALAQELYERHKLLSYPRTDARHLSRTVAARLPAIVEAIRAPYAALLDPETGKSTLGIRFVDDEQVTDHHAIIPTARTPGPEIGSDSDARRLYDLVCRRLLAAWQPDCVETRRELVFEVVSGDITDRYVARRTDITQEGWRRLEVRTRTSRTERVPELTPGNDVALLDVALLEKKTQPPKHFTEATLLSAMESAGKTLQGDAAAAMRDRGLGTPATRAGIIEGLVSRGYVVREGGSLKSTLLGARLVESVCDLLKSAELTGDMEARLRRIERGTESAVSVAEDVHRLVRGLVHAHRPAAPAREDAAVGGHA